MDVIIYHNPQCGTSRTTLGLIRNAGIEPHIIEYVKTPPTRLLLRQLIERMGVSVRVVIREKGTPYRALGLDDPSLNEDQLLDAMMAHPILINRPIVVTPMGSDSVARPRPCSMSCRLSRASSSRKTASRWSMPPGAASAWHRLQGNKLPLPQVQGQDNPA
jgi:arsenate reductase